MEEMSYLFMFTFFFTAPTKFSCCSSNKWLLISRSSSLSLFFSLSFPDLSPTFSFSLSFSFSIFQICGHDNWSKLNTLDNTDTEIISAFRFRLYLSLLHKTRVAMRFSAKITSNYIWVAIPIGWVILHWYTCGAGGRRTRLRSRDYQNFPDR